MLALVNLAPQDANVSIMRFAIMYGGGRRSANRHALFYNVYNATCRLLYFFDAFSFPFFILKKDLHMQQPEHLMESTLP